ncbi:potassium transporter Kup [Parasphingopyxis algicola]|uniref:potassium transporter Kup n=1 Tax=Parasphingopyxis algicola TaxID=2026624 RepID=UPI0015A1CB42|nr:potassium transporter Kup [Parasphingopyxis algicola]QLC24081.1 potassium transporter Kup [Parasphingopyxis algicola]
MSDSKTAHPVSGPPTRDQAVIKLALGAIGIVFGDIGTSPLYAFREAFTGHHPLALDALHLYGVLSLIFWAMMLVVTIKYVTIIMRADNRGEGGSLALLALMGGKSSGKKWSAGIVMLGVLATALFYGDSMITPAVSVLGAVEGLAVVNPSLSGWIVPIAVFILIFLFLIQRSGTAKVGAFFGPIMLFYFLTISVLGILSIVQNPEILWAFSPHYAVQFFMMEPLKAFLALGAVVLAVTGAEALYADMGHFGRKPIGVSWLAFVLPALILNYMGQGALALREGEAIMANPFFMLAPAWFQLPLLIIATLAAIIACQAVISGAFSVTQQAIQLGLMPRLRINHTNAKTIGQIYIPVVNWALMIMVVLLVLTFGNVSNLTAAYGIAVTGAMLMDTCLLTVLLFSFWKWNKLWAGLLVGLFFTVDILFFAANLTKLTDGGWVPLAVSGVAFILLTSWAKGRSLLIAQMRETAMPVQVFVKSAAGEATRVPGTAVFMTTSPEGVPHALLHNLKHNKVLHERIVLLTVSILDRPHVAEKDRVKYEDLGAGFYRIILRYGFMQDANVPKALEKVTTCGPPFRMIETSFFLARQTLLSSENPGMAPWREKLFAWMLRNAETAMQFFRLPPNRVVELGSQVEI